MRDKDFWAEADERYANEAWKLHFPNGSASWIVADDVDTGRQWGGFAKGLWAADSRLPIKNNAEYHGMERRAWQYLATNQYPESRDYFYCAALMRREGAELVIVGPTDAGHAKAVVMCLRMARFASAVGRMGWDLVVAEDYGLDADWVERRVAAAEEFLDGFTDRVVSKSREAN
ncbi:hypothetical protein [Gordonia sp. p3-SID1431]|jgi:hypothetical protein|uniref:hypothetical protein n=1 Tax=Gordonia sp. p3-SID1431 TaxID=2916159 RepID=UPI0021A7F806|nr:hypothetical protein [Gordonia sp. p3-SID1431]MCT1355485.1 hypothetical protein [Gordonia sp. p3-SID1431]